MNQLKSLAAWLHGLLAAMISAIASTLAATLSQPQTYNLYTKAGLIALVKLDVPAGIIAAILYLKQSPLPALSVEVKTTDTHTQVKEVTPK